MRNHSRAKPYKCDSDIYESSHSKFVNRSRDAPEPYKSVKSGKMLSQVKRKPAEELVSKPANYELKPYKCHECGKSFSVKQHLGGHVAAHRLVKQKREHKVKPYKCVTAEKQELVDRARLNSQQKSHRSVMKRKCMNVENVAKHFQKNKVLEDILL